MIVSQMYSDIYDGPEFEVTLGGFLKQIEED